ncbi:MAG: NAD-binding protein [Sulfurospirillaceae bacterium]|nr:NAD-binding protein [Sulfurospirillaceae bacterium]
MDFFISLLVRFAYFIDSSKRYRRTKEFCRTFLEHPTSKLKFYFDLFMVVLVILSVLFLLYEVKTPELHPFMDFFINASLVIFVIEYLLRLWIYSDNHKIFLERYEYALDNRVTFSLFQTIRSIISKKLEYIFSPLAIIDLLAILPSYRPLRFLRIFLLFRIFKLFRYARSMKTFTTIISEKKFELFTLAIFAGFVIFTGSSAIYIFETNVNPKINTLFDAVYWSIVTMGTVGYGDIVPVTTEGMVISMLLIIFGVAILAFLTSIIVSSFQTKLVELKESRTLADIERLKNYILVCGYGRVGEVVAKMLHDDGYAVVIVDTDAGKIKLANQRGMIGILGDASKSKLLGQLGVGKRASKVICVTNSDEMNVFITLTARSLSKDVDIIARVVKSHHKKKYLLAGANFALSADETIGLMGLQYVDQPISYAALNEMLTENTGVVFESLKIHEKSYYVNQPLSVLKLQEKRLLLFGIVRQGIQPTDFLTYTIDDKIFYFNPPSDFLICQEDMLIIMGKKHHINILKKQSDKRPLK